MKGVLEKLELWLAPDAAVLDRTRHGLGFNNLLFMAAELLLLSESAETGVPLLLIEEPEAHLHPQLQLRLREFLEKKTAADAPVQVIVSTHSPNLSSKADIQNFVLMAKGRAFPLASAHTKLTAGDYRFLCRFLDTTKANLFFAHGVVVVEGDAESLLLPTLAQLLGRSFTEYGVSIVNVGSRRTIPLRTDFPKERRGTTAIKIACISDRDIPPDEAKDYVPKTKRQVEQNLPKYEGELQATGKVEAHLNSLRQYDGGVVKTFVSERWTFEYDLALSGLGLELHQAVSFAKKLKNSDRAIPDAERDEAFRAASGGVCAVQPGHQCRSHCCSGLPTFIRRGRVKSRNRPGAGGIAGGAECDGGGGALQAATLYHCRHRIRHGTTSAASTQCQYRLKSPDSDIALIAQELRLDLADPEPVAVLKEVSSCDVQAGPGRRQNHDPDCEAGNSR